MRSLSLSLVLLLALVGCHAQTSCGVNTVEALFAALLSTNASLCASTFTLLGSGVTLSSPEVSHVLAHTVDGRVRLARNVTLRGEHSWTALDVGFLKRRIALDSGVTITFENMALLHPRQPSATSASSTDIVSLVDGARVVFRDVLLVYSLCLPTALTMKYSPAVARPASLPGQQSLAQLGQTCAPGLNYSAACWPVGVVMVDYALAGTTLDPLGVRATLGEVLNLNTTFVCDRLVRMDCISARGLPACVAEAVADNNLTEWETYDLLRAAAAPEPPPEGPGGQGAGGGEGGPPVLAVVLPCVLGGVAVLAAVAAVLVWRRRRGGSGGHGDPEGAAGSVKLGLDDGLHRDASGATGAGRTESWLTNSKPPTDATATTAFVHQQQPGSGADSGANRQAQAALGGASPGIARLATLVSSVMTTSRGNLASGTAAPCSTPGGSLLGNPLLGSGAGGAPIPLNLVLGLDVMAERHNIVGRGTFATVLEGVMGSRPVAVKLFHRDVLGGTEDDLKGLKQEVAILARCQHPNVVELLGAGSTAAGDEVFLVEELMQTNLARACHEGKGLPLARVLSVARDIAAGLAYLHPTVLHRDLKPANVLLDAAGTAKLTDFGLSRLWASTVHTLNPEAGTVQYMAPECFSSSISPGAPSKIPISHLGDMYSFGVLLWEMLSRERPWRGLTHIQVALTVGYEDQRLRLPTAEEDERFHPKLQKIIAQCWEKDPRKRPGAAEVAKRLSLLLQQLESHGAMDAAALASSTTAATHLSSSPASAEAQPSK